MTNKNLIILGLLVIGVYVYLDKKKKDQSKPYSDAELDKLITDLVNKSNAFAVSKGIKLQQDTKTTIEEMKAKFDYAKSQGKDFSKANIDRFFKAYWIIILNSEGDKSQGVSTEEDMNLVREFLKQPQPVQQSEGFFSQTPANVNFQK